MRKSRVEEDQARKKDLRIHKISNNFLPSNIANTGTVKRECEARVYLFNDKRVRACVYVCLGTWIQVKFTLVGRVLISCQFMEVNPLIDGQLAYRHTDILRSHIYFFSSGTKIDVHYDPCQFWLDSSYDIPLTNCGWILKYSLWTEILHLN